MKQSCHFSAMQSSRCLALHMLAGTDLPLMRVFLPRRVRKHLAAQPDIVQLEALYEVARMRRKIIIQHPSGFLMCVLQVGLC